ncbi:hypothetical protein [Sphingomonas sp. NBWT7]|uniref:hypothetical protein n=1 Tax=Sphingomonas sp. NBWT7 TaxID=2596913 RepID=UPI001CA51D0D|nr:hypothetical protein [Sphingomonas sp. NBWT7]
MRSKLSTCRRKARYPSVDAALAAATWDGSLRTYRCDRCGHFHLTSRRKGKFVAAG